eukprot:CAMPEP_0202442388 /NCGR_PEP_ID=MMETSP1360-20130828/1835_1 /ASSEMBLY_ACC=CAM_ASM_000848 /TAXON_ID=515479 /ORGANISM="Licmophora paradoxa, Strain CCMP2313" /LENGTH=236 /DNA_ID=CAMNT_0049057739 /DNA_START=87 /DNA_END=797 /DNA_ORIENTATION=+
MPLFSNYYIRDLSLHSFDRDIDDPIPYAEQILTDYDFIGITERIDESLVAMMMLLDLEQSDILYLKAKGHGHFDDGGFNQTCVYVQPSFVSPGMKEYFESEEWHTRIRGDTALYKAANASLDRTIDEVLGRQNFQTELRKFLKARRLAEETCQDTVVWPCDASGTRRVVASGCLWHDSGCGFKCLDGVGMRFGAEEYTYKSGPWTNPDVSEKSASVSQSQSQSQSQSMDEVESPYR